MPYAAADYTTDRYSGQKCQTESPELAQERIKQLYEQKGYPKDWIDKRLRGIAIRQNLTDECQERGITKERDFSILTANNLDSVEDTLVEALVSLENDQSRAQSLTGFSWIVNNDLIAT